MLHRFALILAWAGVAASASADTVTLANGDELTGEIVDWAVDHVLIEHPQLGRVRLALDQLKIDTGEEPSRGLFDTRFLRGWKRRIDFGWNGRQGDETSTNITAGLRFSYEDSFKRWSLNGRYFFLESSEGDNDNNARVDLHRDWLFPGTTWFARTFFRYQFDEFESWQHRTIFGVGPGYHLVRTEAHKLDVVLGPAFTREHGDVNENKSELLLGVNYDWTIWREIELTVENQLFTNLKPDTGDIRNFTNGRLEIPLLDKPDLDLSIGIENEYESNPEPGDKASDLLYFISLGLGF